jgi:NAD(P)-dependent dehydrogenase (short-subunit alcohol dehydrogenase family)
LATKWDLESRLTEQPQSGRITIKGNAPAASEQQPLFDLAGRSFLVVGATGALGAAVSRALADSGARLTLTAGTAVNLEQLRDELGADRDIEIVDRRPVTPTDAQEMVRAAVTAHGRLDGVIHAAGLNRPALIGQMPEEDFEDILEANLTGAWLVCQAVGARLIDQGEGGKVVLVSSTRGKLGHPNGYSAYCSSKAAVDGLCRALAWEWGKHSINVNALAPTVFRSPLTAWMYGDDEKSRAAREAVLARIPLGRLAEPEDVVGTALFLCSSASDFCTGQTLYVDGGYTAG